MSHLNGIYEAHYQEVASSSSGSCSGDAALRRPGGKPAKGAQANVDRKGPRPPGRLVSARRPAQGRPCDRTGATVCREPAPNHAAVSESVPSGKGKGLKLPSRAQSSRSTRSANANRQQKRAQMEQKEAAQGRTKSSQKNQRTPAACLAHQVAVLPAPASKKLPGGQRQPVCVITPTTAEMKAKKLQNHHKYVTDVVLGGVGSCTAKATGCFGKASAAAQAAPKKPSSTPKSTASQSSCKTLTFNQKEHVGSRAKKAAQKAAAPCQGKLAEMSKLISKRQQISELSWSNQKCYHDIGERASAQGQTRQIPKRSRNHDAAYSTGLSSKQSSNPHSQLQWYQKKETAKNVKTSRNMKAEKANAFASTDSKRSAKSEKSTRRRPEQGRAESRQQRVASPVSGMSKRSQASKKSRKSLGPCASAGEFEAPKVVNGRTTSKSPSRRSLSRNPERSPAQATHAQCHESHSRSQSNRKKHHSKNQLQAQMPQTTTPFSNRLYNQFQQENLQIQKQLMASKAELYEVKFKNKALKSKIEKFRKENEQEKNQHWLCQTRCQKAVQILQHLLYLIEADGRHQVNLLSFVQHAIEVLTARAISKSTVQSSRGNGRRALPQKRDVCVQMGLPLEEAGKLLLESSNEIKQQIISSFKEPWTHTVDECKDDSSSKPGVPWRPPDSIYYTRDVVQERGRRELVVPAAINSDIQSEINADAEGSQMQQASRMFDAEISGSLSVSRKDQQLTEEPLQGTSRAVNQSKNSLPAHLMGVREFEVPQSSDELREDAKMTYQLQFDQPERSQRPGQQPGPLPSGGSRKQTKKNTKRSTANSRTGQAAALANERGATGAVAASNYRDDVNSTLTMQNILRPNNQGATSIAQSSQQNSLPPNRIGISGAQSNQGLGCSSSAGKPGTIRHQNIMQLLQQAAGSAGDNAADSQCMETIGQELNKLMKFGGTLPGLVQGNAKSNNNFTLNTALATALIAASQTGTASGTNGLLKCLPLDDTAGSKDKMERELANHANQLETQSIGTYAHISLLQKQNLKQVQQLLQHSASSTEEYGQLKDRCGSGQACDSNNDTLGKLSGESDTAKLSFLQNQQAATGWSRENGEGRCRDEGAQMTRQRAVFRHEDDGQQRISRRDLHLSSSEEEARQVTPRDMFIEYNDENDPNLNNIRMDERQGGACSSSESEVGQGDSERPVFRNADDKMLRAPQSQDQAFSDRSFRPPRPETVEDIRKPHEAAGHAKPDGPSCRVSGDTMQENIFAVRQRIEGSLEEDELPETRDHVPQQQEGIQIQIQKEHLNEISEDEPHEEYSYCAEFGGQVARQQQLLNASAPHTEIDHNDSIMMQGHMGKLQHKKQSQQTNGDPQGRVQKELRSQDLKPFRSDQKVKLLSNLYQCSEIEQQVSPGNETDLTLLYHYNVFKGRAFAAAPSASHLQPLEGQDHEESDELQLQGSIPVFPEGGHCVDAANLMQAFPVGDAGPPARLQNEDGSQILAIGLQQDKSKPSCEQIYAKESERAIMKPILNIDLEQNDSIQKDLVSSAHDLVMLHPYSSMLETSLDNSQKIDKIFEDNLQESHQRRSTSNPKNAEATRGVEDAQKKNLSHISHLSKITSHPSNNSQCLHISKISKDADSFGAAVERGRRGRSKGDGRDSHGSESLEIQDKKKDQERGSSVIAENRLRDQNSFSAACKNVERDGACINNDSSHLVNIASAGTCHKNACFSSEVSNLDRTSEVMANGDLQARMQHIQQLYQNLIGRPGPPLDPGRAGAPADGHHDRSSDGKEIEQIKLNLQALKNAQHEHEAATRDAADSLSNPRHSQATSNMFDNVTNTLTTLTSNVASNRGQTKPSHKYHRQPQQKGLSVEHPSQSYADSAANELPYNDRHQPEAGQKEHSASPSSRQAIEVTRQCPRTANILQEISELDKQIGEMRQNIGNK